MAQFPELDFDFSQCHEEWDYEPHTIEGAVHRAERVREKLKELARAYEHKHIVWLLIGDSSLSLFLGRDFRLVVRKCLNIEINLLIRVLETRSYRFAMNDEVEGNRYAVNVDTLERQDFGPNLLLPSDSEI